MKFSVVALSLLAGCLLPLAGCAKSPSGGPSLLNVNTLQATLTVKAATVPQFSNVYYAVAFDDQAGGDGPAGIDRGTPIRNGIVGGNFRFAVLYDGALNQFRYYYRSDPTDYTTEQDVTTSTTPLFLVAPRFTGNGIDFTLNLDAMLNGTTYIFPRAADGTTLNLDRIDLNFVTSNAILIDGNTQTKPVDAAGDSTISGSNAVLNFQVNTTRNSSISDPTGDFRVTAPAGYDLDLIDVTQLVLRIRRNNN